VRGCSDALASFETPFGLLRMTNRVGAALLFVMVRSEPQASVSNHAGIRR